jgi:uncharacterized protein (DUF433 family)
MTNLGVDFNGTAVAPPAAGPVVGEPARLPAVQPTPVGATLARGGAITDVPGSTAPWTRRFHTSTTRSSKLRHWLDASADLDRVDIDPTRSGGQPIIRGTRIPIYSVVAHAARGRSTAEIIDQLDGRIDAEDVRQAFLYAAALCRA